MIFVDINYRYGPFGFLASERVRKNGDINAGLLDQRFALKWVQQHISEVNLIILLDLPTSTDLYFIVHSSEEIPIKLL